MLNLARMTAAVLLGMAVVAGTIAGAVGQPVAQEALQALGNSVLVRDPSGTGVLSVFSLVVLVAAASAPLLLVGAGIVHLMVLRVMALRIEALFAVAGRLDANVMRRHFLQVFRRWGVLKAIAARYLAALVVERDPVRDGTRLVSSRPAADFFTADAMLMDPATKALFDRLPLICVVLGVLGLLADLGNGLLRMRTGLGAAVGGDTIAILIDRATAGVVLLFGCVVLAVIAAFLRWLLSAVGQPLANRLQTAVDALFWRPARNPAVMQPASDTHAAEWLTDALTLIDQRFDSESRARREMLAELREVFEVVLAASRDRADEGRRVHESLQRIAQQFGDAMTETSRGIAALAPAMPLNELNTAVASASQGIVGLRDELLALKHQETTAAADDRGLTRQVLGELRAAVDGMSQGIAGLRDELQATKRDTNDGAAAGERAMTQRMLGELRSVVDGTSQGIVALRDELAAIKRQEIDVAPGDGGAAARAQVDEVSARLVSMSDAMRASIGQLASIVDSLSRIAASLGQRPEKTMAPPRAPLPDKAGSQALLSELRELISDADVANLDREEPPAKRGGGAGA